MRALPASLVALALLGTMPATGQDLPAAAGGAGWLGVAYDLRWIQRAGECQPRIVVEAVVEGAPADRAGLRAGDAILALDGERLGSAGVELVPGRLRAGDPVRLRVLRPEGRVQEIVAVADRRPVRPPVSLRGSLGGLAASGAPVVRLAGDTLIAQNLRPGWRPERGYWLAHGDGRTEYRRVRRYEPTELDRRVATLVACATEGPHAGPQAVRPAPDLQRLHARADSLRQVHARRALARRGPDGPRTLRDVDVVAIPRGPGEAPVVALTVADHVMAGERGIAGAEITPLDPELAEYFRGVREGLLVLRVAPGSPAARAGLRPGDVITRADGRRVESVGALRRLLAAPEAAPLELRVVRHGRSRPLTIRRD